jgi:hypothetical protein
LTSWPSMLSGTGWPSISKKPVEGDGASNALGDVFRNFLSQLTVLIPQSYFTIVVRAEQQSSAVPIDVKNDRPADTFVWQEYGSGKR